MSEEQTNSTTPETNAAAASEKKQADLKAETVAKMYALSKPAAETVDEETATETPAAPAGKEPTLAELRALAKQGKLADIFAALQFDPKGANIPVERVQEVRSKLKEIRERETKMLAYKTQLDNEHATRLKGIAHLEAAQKAFAEKDYAEGMLAIARAVPGLSGADGKPLTLDDILGLMVDANQTRDPEVRKLKAEARERREKEKAEAEAAKKAEDEKKTAETVKAELGAVSQFLGSQDDGVLKGLASFPPFVQAVRQAFYQVNPDEYDTQQEAVLAVATAEAGRLRTNLYAHLKQIFEPTTEQSGSETVNTAGNGLGPKNVATLSRQSLSATTPAKKKTPEEVRAETAEKLYALGRQQRG